MEMAYLHYRYLLKSEATVRASCLMPVPRGPQDSELITITGRMLLAHPRARFTPMVLANSISMPPVSLNPGVSASHMFSLVTLSLGFARAIYRVTDLHAGVQRIYWTTGSDTLSTVSIVLIFL